MKQPDYLAVNLVHFYLSSERTEAPSIGVSPMKHESFPNLTSKCSKIPKALE